MRLFKSIAISIPIAFFIYLLGVEVTSYYISVGASLSIILTGLLTIYIFFKKKYIGITSLLYSLIFILPFIHLLPYLWIGYDNPTKRMWGLISNPYQFDESIISLLGVMGAAGVMGMVLVVCLFAKHPVQSIQSKISIISSWKSMPFLIWLVWLTAGLAFSMISAPHESIFEAKYTFSNSISREINISSAWLLSYVMLLFVLYDAIVDKIQLRRRLKLTLFTLVFLYIIIVLQFLRGDRESLPWILSIYIMLSYWMKPYISLKKTTSFSKKKLILFVVIMFVLSVVVGYARSRVSDVSFNINNMYSLLEGLIERGDIFKGTWSAVLLTPLSVAGDSIYYHPDFLLGQDYVNLFLSLPPGFVADFFEYSRPWSNDVNPQKEMIYGLGGVHATVLPFRNFGLFGIFIINALFFLVIIRYERKLLFRPGSVMVIGLAVLVTVIPHWLWYSDKNLVNGLIAYVVLLFLYRISLVTSKKLQPLKNNKY